MPNVTDNQLQGNFAAAYVTARLSASCLVRPVSADTDVGVDLYCETLEQGQPFLHFWVQVKSGAQCRLTSDDSIVTCSFDRHHLEYWRRQPVPVFAALVPVTWPVERDPAVYIANLTQTMLFDDLGDGQRCSIRSSSVWLAGDRHAVHHFLAHDVPATDAQMQCRRGVVTTTTSLEPQYVNPVPGVPVTRFQRQILDQLRRTAAFSVLQLATTGGEMPDTVAFRRRCAAIVAQFHDDEHWENSAARALSFHLDGEFALAVPLYDEAIAHINGDANLVRSYWTSTVAELRRRRDQCASGQLICWPKIGPRET